jgi:hypothetical protein
MDEKQQLAAFDSLADELARLSHNIEMLDDEITEVALDTTLIVPLPRSVVCA